MLVGGLEQKISDEHNLIEVFDIALKYLVENVDQENYFKVRKRNERQIFMSVGETIVFTWD